MLSALAEITAEIACTYPVDFTNSGRDAVPPDATNEYDYLWVEVLRTDTGTVERAYNVSSPVNPTPGLGWEFASSERKFVRMSQGYCNLINSGNIRVVETQLACLCQQTEGADCSVPGAAALGVCPEGTWTCVEGIDICEPDPDCCTNNEPCNTGLPGVCAVGRIVCTETGPICERVVDPSAEICDGLDNDCDGIVDELDGSNCTVEGQTGRCAVGVRTCSGASEACEPLYGPMPEICNGLDDDCDGTTDNITESWSKQQFDNITLTPAQRSLTCDLRNLCSCPSGEDDHAGGTFDEYIDNWDPVCLCGDGVEWDEGAAAADADMDDLGEGGCASGDGGTVPGLFLTLLGLFFFRRRRDVA
jgi:MYXO-CTERM domain-containing protein